MPQVYVGYEESVGEPPAQLKAFDAVGLDPGESRTVALMISRDDLAVYDETSSARVFPPGELTFSVGFSSRDIAATTRLRPT